MFQLSTACVDIPTGQNNGSDENGRTSRNGSLNVYIVEEHHEVLQYWFREAEKGRIPKHGNTLVHIDGHGDMATPWYVNGFPFFRYPKGPTEVSKMMQTNDVFIMGAVMAGLIRRVVWVWPWWDRESHGDMYKVDHLSVGWTSVKNPNDVGQSYLAFCCCVFNVTSNETECTYTPSDDSFPDGLPLPTGECRVKKTVILEEIREDRVFARLRSGKWFSESESVILDIDEDFYGCTYAVQPLIFTGIQLDTIQEIDRLVGELFCPKSAHAETAVDKLIMTVINMFRNTSYCHTHDSEIDKKQICNNEMRISLAETFMVSNLSTRANEQLLCVNGNTMTSRLIKRLLIIFSNLKIKQLRSLQNVGFCLTTTPRSYQAISRSVFQTCHGANTPKSSSVSIHKPTWDEISRKTKLLRQHLQLMGEGPGNPAVVTVCRSIRDGYTPRYFSGKIESDIISSVKSVFKNSVINYDRELLGGKRGWAARHKVSFL
ncbi:hypothetical protein ScPMuIL_004030 [Solemya velum]